MTNGAMNYINMYLIDNLFRFTVTWSDGRKSYFKINIIQGFIHIFNNAQMCQISPLKVKKKVPGLGQKRNAGLT
jgi:hypothetical protein